ncbi:MAG TPA: hypothetical protein VME46_12800, partial [Acidimicrobiales bacterium]|nr:hypothetical protein [Acidimicrobiales bacterium]
PVGTVRWEAECRKGWLMGLGGMRLLSDLNDGNCIRLAKNRWNWSAMDVAFGGPALVRQRLRDLGKKVNIPPGFLVWLDDQADGVEKNCRARATLAKYRKLQRQLGIVITQEGPQFRDLHSLRRLDWESGQLLAVDDDLLWRSPTVA